MAHNTTHILSMRYAVELMIDYITPKIPMVSIFFSIIPIS